MTTTPLTGGQLADRIVAAVGHGLRYAEADPDSVLPETVNAVLAVVHPELDRLAAERDELLAELDGRDEKARKRWIKNQEKQLGIKYADFRAGRWEMDLAMGREMAAAYVAMAKTLLGDAPNYTETKLEFDVKIAESPETYTLVVQRHAPGALTPHEARQRSEAELGRVRAELATVQAERDAARERLASYGTPVLSFPPLPPESPYAAKRSADRALMESGFVPEAGAWAVGMAICHEGRKCPAGEVGIFELTKRGRLPVHRDDYERRCPGSGQKAEPLKLAAPAASPSA
ncbi:hypothetical protein GCM10010193_69780 [Kitasatospora atroaurantiaca]|uniref:Uncharacterized protein n=1 Tax=Kitasatospora atroaurantiaca TaxID=285545 RepID=A0A561EN78_9ACTN|nr:hypothetical protein [Kitasatospora atroaurantiaca]TWE17064.1 hypothetical protein FB465_2068 [Kitasatospora atroaurantiaca]